MNAYIYNAALYCEGCGNAIKADLDAQNLAPADIHDESSYDSSDYPKGPYPDGGGEADSPQHCDACGAFLANPLTGDGYDYACELVESYVTDGRGASDVLRQWFDHYELVAWSGLWNIPGYLPDSPPAVFVSGPDAAPDGAEKSAREYVADSMLEAAESEYGESSSQRFDEIKRKAESIRCGDSDSETVPIGGNLGMAYEVSSLDASELFG